MDPIVIDALRAAANDAIYPDLSRLMGTDHTADCAEVTALDTLLDSLAMDQDTQRQISDCAMDIFSAGEERGFRNGFRIAARLLLECVAGMKEAP